MEVIGSLYTEVSDAFQKGIKKDYARCIKAEKHDLGVVLMNDVKVIGQMDNTIDHTFESANRVYDISGIAPTVNTCGGGGLQPKILEVKKLGFMDNGTGKHQSNTVYNENALFLNITMIESGGTQQIKVLTETTCVAMRGRNPENPSDRTAGNPTEQRLEMNMQGTSNCLTSVQKDNLVMENCYDFYNNQLKENGICRTITGACSHNGSGTFGVIGPKYRIRKLTPRECGRLMGVSDEDISKMATVNSNTQLYKQFGNSIVVDVMVAMFKNLNIEQK